MTHYIWVDRLSPYLFHFSIYGHELGVHWYGLAYVLGFVLAYTYFHGAVQKKRISGLDEDSLYELTISVAFGVLLGGRIGFVVQHLHELITDPLWALRIWEGGMAFFGGLAGVLIAIFWIGRQRHIGFLALNDVAVFPASLGLAIGRIANFINGELVGKPTRANFGVIFPNVDLLPRYPSQLFEGAATFLLFLSMIVLRRVPWISARPGRLGSFFLIIYGLLRFATDFYRDDATYWGPISDGQWFSLLIAVIGCVILYFVFKPLTATTPDKLAPSEPLR
jgi:phosphatidylglycerol:prolipoprotein diacylglycerol transferase